MKIFKVIILLTFLLILSNTSYSQQQSDTSKILLTFSEPMCHEGIFDVHNYQIIKDDSTSIKIYKVGVATGDSLIVLFTEKQTPQASYKIIINNIKDKAGNLISESHKMAVY